MRRPSKSNHNPSGAPSLNPCTVQLDIACEKGKCTPESSTACTYSVASCAETGDCCKVIGITDGINFTWIHCSDVAGSPGANLGGAAVGCGGTMFVWFLAVTSQYCDENALDEPFPGQALAQLTCGYCQ